MGHQVTKRAIRLIGWILPLLLIGPDIFSGSAQNDCPALVYQALDAVGQVCSSMDRNEACYANSLVHASFADNANVTFDKPADRAPLNAIEELQTSPLDEALNQWGVAVMSIQANLPDTLPGQAVKFILYGDVSIENAGGEQPSIEDYRSVTAEYASILRSGPGTDNRIVTYVREGTQLLVQGRSEDGNWLFTSANGHTGWIGSILVSANFDIRSELNVLNGSQPVNYGPMQAFYFTTGVGAPNCHGMPPSALVIQSPHGYTVSLNANGVNISMGSTIALTAVQGQEMRIATLQGQAIAEVDNFRRSIPAGFEVSMPLSEDREPRAAGLPNLPRPIRRDTWAAVEQAPVQIFDQPVVVPNSETIGDTNHYCADPANAQTCSDPAFYQEAPAECGNLVCEAGEDNASCSADCQPTPCPEGGCAPTEVPPTLTNSCVDCISTPETVSEPPTGVPDAVTTPAPAPPPATPASDTSVESSPVPAPSTESTQNDSPAPQSTPANIAQPATQNTTDATPPPQQSSASSSGTQSGTTDSSSNCVADCASNSSAGAGEQVQTGSGTSNGGGSATSEASG
jgi:hypothetical protein